MAGVVHVPWYATAFRHDKLAAALAEISAVSLRYGALSHRVYRYRDDRYKFLQTVEMPSKEAWEDYWYGPEFVEMRALTQSWYQVPVLYGWADLVTSGALQAEGATAGAGAGAGEVGDLPA
jgi:hypothetical protein